MPSIDANVSSAPSRQRPARTFAGWLLRGAIVVVGLSALCVALAWGNGWRPWRAPVEPQTPARPANPDLFAANARRAARGVVLIETVGQANTRALGAGFVLSPDGLIATNFHVVASATEAQVRLSDGRVFAVAGYAAADRRSDLAILRLAAPPSDLLSLPLAEEGTPVAPAAQVMAIGHPRGVRFSLVDGRLSRPVYTRELPDDSRRFVQRLTGSDADLRWLQHSATLAQGHSGGPLIDRAGRVIGINTWTNVESRTNYALDVAYLRLLKQQVSRETTIPLEQLARTDAQASAVVARLSAQRLEELAAEAEAIRWVPASQTNYRTLQELATAMTIAHVPQAFLGDKFDRERMHELEQAVIRLEARLAERKDFGAPDQVTFVNELASLYLTDPRAGLFFFGQVERVVEGEGGQRGMLMQLVGSDQMLFLPLEGDLFEPKPGAVYAVFGVNPRGEVVRYGDNPLQLIRAPVILSRTFVAVE